MQRSYESSYDLWLKFQDGTYNAVKSVHQNIWIITEKATGEQGWIFSDETENFYPEIFTTSDEAFEAMQKYMETL
ncbi:hypothetical protein [Pectobacterium phage Wc4-1]|uniref:Uncharacterized protein n=1 Tax=Pectobacterium phage Wc4 TaxID=2652428 RepID=A0A5P8D4C8_9CAUD|nr:hypothetical protein [Pectobacterium phage Wc4]QFP94030.1 hypothetical protein [Pectobacterium phage Wc4-1]